MPHLSTDPAVAVPFPASPPADPSRVGEADWSIGRGADRALYHAVHHGLVVAIVSAGVITPRAGEAAAFLVSAGRFSELMAPRAPLVPLARRRCRAGAGG